MPYQFKIDELIKHFEGLRLTAYKDVAGHLTVGYGHLVLPEDNIELGDKITETRAKQLLHKDIRIAETAVNRLVKVPLTDNQKEALVSFVFNFGQGALARSTLLKLLNKGEYLAARHQFTRWVNITKTVIVNGKRKKVKQPLNGLIRRRFVESSLFAGYYENLG